MSQQAPSPRRNAVRLLAWSCLLAVPAIAAVAVGPALSQDSSVTVADGMGRPLTRAHVPAVSRSADRPEGAWQNTLLPIFFPGQFSTYFPPGP
jgi:hypothetical protein